MIPKMIPTCSLTVVLSGFEFVHSFDLMKPLGDAGEQPGDLCVGES